MILLTKTGIAQEDRVITFDLKFNISAPGNTSKLKLMCLVPNDAQNRQKVINMTYSKQPDRVFHKKGNRYAEFIYTDLKQKEELIISVELQIFKSDFHSSKNVRLLGNGDLSETLKHELYIESNNYDIIRKAKQLTGTNPLETIKNIFEFVNKKVAYGGYFPGDLGAAECLRVMKGDCTEFSDLFVALCRANKIPARIVDGYITEFDQIPKHTWVEAYLDKYGWVSFDPTPGNGSGFETRKNMYIQLSTVRNDENLYQNHFWVYHYWGDPVEVSDSFNLKL